MVAFPSTAPALKAIQPHLDEHGSVKVELITHALHGDALYHDVNITVYYKLEETTIKPFQHHKNGGGATCFIS